MNGTLTRTKWYTYKVKTHTSEVPPLGERFYMFFLYGVHLEVEHEPASSITQALPSHGTHVQTTAALGRQGIQGGFFRSANNLIG